MKVLAIILTTVLATATADSVRGIRRLEDLEHNVAKLTVFSQIQLAPTNEVSPFVGVVHASGIAEITLDYDNTRPNKYRICIKSEVIGFTPGQLQVHRGKITENGASKVKFYIDTSEPTYEGCRNIVEELYNDMAMNAVS